jgi:hypothetical protein
MTDTLAQIGAVFFLAVLFMAGTLTRDLFPKGILKTVKLSMLVVAALLVGFVVYRRLPDISRVLPFTLSGSTQPPAQGAPAPGVAIKQSDAPRPATKIRKVQTIHQAAPALDAAPEIQETSIPAADPPSAVSQPLTDAPSPPSSLGETSASVQSWRATPAQESRNPVERAITSVGHFFHIGHEKYQPPPSVPQPAAAP